MLDAHAFIWWVLDMPNLSEPCRRILADGENDVLLSAASCYEIAYKAAQGRLTLPDAPDEYIRKKQRRDFFYLMRSDTGISPPPGYVAKE